MGNSIQKIRSNSLLWLWVSALAFMVDRTTKLLAESYLVYAEANPVISGFFDITLLYNKGAAFSFLAEAGGWQRWLFSGVALLMSIVLIIWLKKTASNIWWLCSGLALILGGALGNLYDRMFLGQVVDFLSFHFGNYSFPAFNVADICISIGAFLLIVDMLFFEKNRLANEEKENTSE